MEVLHQSFLQQEINRIIIQIHVPIINVEDTITMV